MKNYSELPVPIIHLIHSLLTDKEAAQTALVSRSWAFARSTRPIIFLDEDRVPLPILAVIANKTFKRYEESNLPIHTFRLCLNRQWYVTPPEWISKALKLGASDITIRVNKNRNFHVPIAEIFGSENVVRLCLENLIISRLKVVKCSGLESLALTLVDLSLDSFRTIISSCPLIKHLSLIKPRFKFSDDEPGAQLRTMYLTTISHHKLTSLALCNVELDQLRTLFLRDFSSKFPVLRELTIAIDEHVFQQAYEIRVISSLSLEFFNFRLTGGGGGKSFCPKDLRRVELDLPSIRKFTFEGSCMPKMWLRPTLEDQREDFHVSMSHRGHPSTTWFRQMCKFLTNLERSNIHLTLHVRGSRFSSDYKVLGIKGLNTRKVKFLSVHTEEGLGSEFFNSLLDGMFWVCRPKMVTHYADPSYSDTYRSSDDHKYRKITNNGLLLCRALQLGMEKSALSWENRWTKHGLCGPKEVHAQELKEEVWMPQTIDSILDDSTSEERVVRFKLKWKRRRW